MLQQKILETPRLLLRAARPDDAPALYEAFKDEDVMQYWSELPHISIERTKEWLSSMVESSQNGITDFIICLKNDAKEDPAIGKIGVYRGRPSNEIGFMIKRRHWGKGLVTEALTCMLNYLFHLKRDAGKEDEGLEDAVDQHTSLSNEEMQSEWLYASLSADVDPRNEASIGLLKKVGFIEGALARACFQRGDEFVDSLYLRLSRAEWLKT